MAIMHVREDCLAVGGFRDNFFFSFFLAIAGILFALKETAWASVYVPSYHHGGNGALKKKQNDRFMGKKWVILWAPRAQRR